MFAARSGSCPLLFGRCCLALVLCVRIAAAAVPRKFWIEEDTFLKDGSPFVIRAGALDYFRVPPQYHRDRMQRLKALGLNTVSTYIAWNYHERVEGQIERVEELTSYLDLAQEEGLLVFLRVGPYICAEWEFGGLPAYLLAKPYLRLRTFDMQYLAAVGRFWDHVMPRLKGHLYSEGGPVVLVQIENEFGHFGNCEVNPDDAKYMNHLLNLLEMYLGNDVIYTTIDGMWSGGDVSLAEGSPWKHSARVLATIDGEGEKPWFVNTSFGLQKAFNAKGRSPEMWAELWIGWFTRWGDESVNKSSDEVTKGLKLMMERNASFSLFTAHGGTSFGFYSGANGHLVPKWSSQNYHPTITSYDYCAPISEAGDHNFGTDGVDLFAAIRDVIGQTTGPAPAEPPALPKRRYGQVNLTEAAMLLGNIDALATCSRAVPQGLGQFPSMEELGQAYGFVLYRLTEPFPGHFQHFTDFNLHDRVQVHVNSTEVGHAYRGDGNTTLFVPEGTTLELLVENMGRINYGFGMYDRKGLLMNPPVSDNWTAYCLPLEPESVRALPFKPRPAGNASALRPSSGPVFWRGYLMVTGEVHDTFLDTGGLNKGYAWMNGNAIGRYWETQGPQHTLYIPGPFLQPGLNELIILDLHGWNIPSAVKLVGKPRYHAPASQPKKPPWRPGMKHRVRTANDANPVGQSVNVTTASPVELRI